MNNKSRKAKGRYLQNLVKDRILKMFPRLTNKDIRCAKVSENGADIKLMSLMARKLMPYNIETVLTQIYLISKLKISNLPVLAVLRGSKFTSKNFYLGNEKVAVL